MQVPSSESMPAAAVAVAAESKKWPLVLVALGVLALGAGICSGAVGISAQSGYGGIGPNFLPWCVGFGLLVCGVLLLLQLRTQGDFRDREQAPGSATGRWMAWLWMSAGMLLNAALLEPLGFIFSCTLCFVFAVQAFRSADAAPRPSLSQVLRDTALGLVLAAPVYWLFSKFFGLRLPGLTQSGWL